MFVALRGGSPGQSDKVTGLLVTFALSARAVSPGFTPHRSNLCRAQPQRVAPRGVPRRRTFPAVAGGEAGSTGRQSS